MIREITLGQYYPADSVIHKLDPRTKLMATFVYIVSLFVADSLWTYLLGGLFWLRRFICRKCRYRILCAV